LSRLFLDSLRANDAAGAYRVASHALEDGMTIAALYRKVVTPAMYAIGDLWEKGAITVADEHLATALTHRVLAALRPPIQVEADAERPEGRTAMLATAQGEQHALGLRMVADVLEDAGYRTIYLGADVPTEALLQAIASLSPDLLALSATMPELAVPLEQTAARVRRAHPDLELLVGGQAARLAAGTREVEIENLELLTQRTAPAER
jgi:MerR family transcriptional regulator, light-induced transcriptional regulator